MTRNGHVGRVLDEFRASYPALTPLAIEKAWHWTWTAQEARAFNRQSGWRRVTGVYLFIEFCPGNDIHAESADERFSVIRRIGKAEYSFADRINDYFHRVADEPGPRLAWHRWDGRLQKWFRYSQIDIIRINAASASALETYLLNRIPTQYNDKDVPPDLKGNPIIYDASTEAGPFGAAGP